MLFGLVSFSGRLSRLGWLLNIVIAIIVFVASITAIANLSDRAPLGLDRDTRDTFNLILSSVCGLALLSILGATVRRMRDAGSRHPFIAMIFGAIVPGFGWMYLLGRLLFAGSKAEIETAANQKADKPAARKHKKTAKQKNKAIAEIWKSNTGDVDRDLDRGKAFVAEAEAAAKVRLNAAAVRHHVHGKSGGSTVTRLRRGSPVKSRRRVAF